MESWEEKARERCYNCNTVIVTTRWDQKPDKSWPCKCEGNNTGAQFVVWQLVTGNLGLKKKASGTSIWGEMIGRLSPMEGLLPNLFVTSCNRHPDM